MEMNHNLLLKFHQKPIYQREGYFWIALFIRKKKDHYEGEILGHPLDWASPIFSVFYDDLFLDQA